MTNSDDEIYDDTYVYEQFVVRVLPVSDFIVRQAPYETKPLKSDDHLNVLVVALNGVSRDNWEQRLPLSSTFLRDQLRGVTLTGFNLLGDSISSNIVPMLTGNF